eukprot:TRINITY_DN56069_c0_g2_i1.p1 TRINITY_DN56069_c0_g2~~TRINITY_DN56069_c0_g2_i1.p1  ORF type:complete len:412 (+),score=91.22 TRINITY_DN56069_c0_g2_i1:189-1424(+)
MGRWTHGSEGEMRLGNRSVFSDKEKEKADYRQERGTATPSSPVVPQEGKNRAAASETTAAILALLSCFLYCANGELLQALQLHMPPDAGHCSPLLNLLLCHLGGLLFIPYLMFGQGERCTGQIEPKEHYGGMALPSLLFAMLLMGYNYAWLSSAKLLDVSLTNAIFQTSVAIVCAASVVLFGEALTRPRAMGVMLALAGSALAAGVGPSSILRDVPQRQVLGHEMEMSGRLMTAGVPLALMASAGYAIYQVLFKYWYGCYKGDIKFLAYFGVWVSFWHVTFLPLIFLAHAVGFETMQLPRAAIAVAGTLVSAMIASVVNILYLCIIMWGSPMMLPCASAFSVPMTVLFDFLIHGVRPRSLECVGHVMVALSVLLIVQVNPTIGSTSITAGGDRSRSSVKKPLPVGKATDDV